MMQCRGLVVVAAIGWLAAGCATMNVSAHVERSIDFTNYKTYAWGPADQFPTGDPRLDNNPFLRDYLTGAVDRQLARRGYRLTTTGTPDLMIHYHANVTQRFEVHGVDRAWGYDPNAEPTVAEYEEGTIVVDVTDVRLDKVVWRGWAQDSITGLIDNQDRMEKQVKKSIDLMFTRFPATPLATAPAPPGR